MAPGEQRKARECAKPSQTQPSGKVCWHMHKAPHPQLSDRHPAAPWTCYRHMSGTNRPRAKAGEDRQEKMVSWQCSLTPSGGCNKSINPSAIWSTLENISLETTGSATPLQCLGLSAKENLSWELPWEQWSPAEVSCSSLAQGAGAQPPPEWAPVHWIHPSWKSRLTERHNGKERIQPCCWCKEPSAMLTWFSHFGTFNKSLFCLNPLSASSHYPKVKQPAWS